MSKALNEDLFFTKEVRIQQVQEREQRAANREDSRQILEEVRKTETEEVRASEDTSETVKTEQKEMSTQ